MGWNEKKFSRREVALGTAEIAGKTTNDRELPERSCFAGPIKIPFLDFEQAIANQHFAFRSDQVRLHVFELDALNRLLNVQTPLRSRRRLGAAPNEPPASRIDSFLGSR